MNIKSILILAAFNAIFHLPSARDLDLPPQVGDYLQKQHLLDEGEEPLPDDQAKSADVFIEYTIANWQSMLDNISTIASTPRQQRLIIRAIEYLPGKTYLDALNKLCDLEEKGTIPNATLEFAANGRMPKNGFLANNYQDPRVIRLVQRFRKLLPKDSKTQTVLTDILNGKRIKFEQEKSQDEDLGQPEKLTPQ